jgi:hypothetical protein
MSRMTYMRSWKSHRITSHTWLGLNPQIGRPLSRIVVPLVYLFMRGVKKISKKVLKTKLKPKEVIYILVFVIYLVLSFWSLSIEAFSVFLEDLLKIISVA